MLAVPSASSSVLEFNVFPWFFTEKGRYFYLRFCLRRLLCCAGMRCFPCHRPLSAVCCLLRRDVYSTQLQNTRDLVVYVPPSFDENPFKSDYPLLIMHDGQVVLVSSACVFSHAHTPSAKQRYVCACAEPVQRQHELHGRSVDVPGHGRPTGDAGTDARGARSFRTLHIRRVMLASLLCHAQIVIVGVDNTDLRMEGTLCHARSEGCCFC